MGFYKFAFLLSVHRGVFGLESAEEASEEHSLLDRWSRSKQIWVRCKKLISFRRQLIVRHIIKIDYCKLCVITQSAVGTPHNVLQYSNLYSESELPKINKQNPELSVVFVSQPVAAHRGPCRDLLRRLPWDKTFGLTKRKRETTILNPHGKSTVAQPLTFGPVSA